MGMALHCKGKNVCMVMGVGLSLFAMDMVLLERDVFEINHVFYSVEKCVKFGL